jgi:glycosyltransferase involved in cell wall biosynthesis
VGDETPQGRPDLLVFADDWGRHPSSCQHLVRHLLGRHRVHWVNTIGMRTPRLTSDTFSRGFEKVRLWSRGPRDPQALPANLEVTSPVMWPWFRSAFDRRLNRTLLLRHLKPLVASRPAPPIAVTTIPVVADLVGALPVARWVYYCVDDFGAWPGLDQETMRAMESRLVRRSDLVIAASEVLKKRVAAMGKDAHLLTHGIDLDHWACAGRSGSITGLDGLERPLVVFWGAIDRRMDCRFLQRLAADLTAGTIVLAGPRSDPDPAIDGLRRCVCLPPLPYESLPLLAKEAAVLVMPYADLPVTRAIQPLKLKEYLATGKPVVARDLPATRPWADCLDLARTPESFSHAVRYRLETGLPRRQERARGRLDRELWTEKVRDFEQWILEPRPAEHVTRAAVAQPAAG